VADNSVAIADELKHSFKLRTVHIFAGTFINEGSINLNTFQLPGFVLIQTADSDVSDALPFHV
jgi:hypothetical protein